MSEKASIVGSRPDRSGRPSASAASTARRTVGPPQWKLARPRACIASWNDAVPVLLSPMQKTRGRISHGTSATRPLLQDLAVAVAGPPHRVAGDGEELLALRAGPAGPVVVVRAGGLVGPAGVDP